MSYRRVYGDSGLGNINGSATSLPAGYTLGEVRYNDIGTKKYRLFYNAGGASLPTGYVQAKDAAGAGPYSGITATTETGATFAICCNDNTKTVPTASYYWGCVQGHPVQLLVSNISIATDVAVLAATDGKVIPATVPTMTPFAVNVGDSASANVGTGATDSIGPRFRVFFESAYEKIQDKLA